PLGDRGRKRIRVLAAQLQNGGDHRRQLVARGQPEKAQLGAPGRTEEQGRQSLRAQLAQLLLVRRLHIPHLELDAWRLRSHFLEQEPRLAPVRHLLTRHHQRRFVGDQRQRDVALERSKLGAQQLLVRFRQQSHAQVTVQVSLPLSSFCKSPSPSFSRAF